MKKNACDRNIVGLLIDLDDTLFLEHTYVLSGINAVVDFVCKTHLPKNQSDTLKLNLQYQFLKFGRINLFNDIVEMVDNLEIDEVVSVYRNHKPEISLMTGVREVLEQLSQSYQLALVTDGNSGVQRNKIEALDIERYFEAIIFCDVDSTSVSFELILTLVFFRSSSFIFKDDFTKSSFDVSS